MEHISLRPHVDTADDLYTLLGRLQTIAMAGIGWRMIACVVCLTVALVTSGAIAKTATVLAVLGGMAWVWAVMDYISRDWAMHALDLHDLIRPRDTLQDALALVDALLAEQAELSREDAGRPRGDQSGGYP